MAELSKSTEDYLETIYNLLDKKHEATVKNIAKYMSVSLPAVTSALRNLNDKEYVIYKAYEPVKLTKKGKEIAKEVISRHLIIRSFLHNVLKLSEEEANNEACSLEHAMSEVTIKKLSSLMDKIRKFLGLNKLPHFTTIQKFFVRMSNTKLKDLNDLINFMHPSECKLVAMDGTGHTSDYVDKYYAQIRGKSRKSYIKNHIAINVDTRMILNYATNKRAKT